ncbi:MAG: L-aspartate oxidase [Ponticaulis sp.]|nr:L-aspartate oxidase [Ponticaulis sp.]
MSERTDILIVGAGLAGLFLALRLAPRKCTVICPAPLGQAASSAWAQGGLAAALAPDDSPDNHAADTVRAGDGLVDPVTAQLIAEAGPLRVRDLIELGVPFDRTPEGALALSLEAAHSHPRVARVAGDLAGKAIMQALTDAVMAAEHITVLDGLKAVALLKSDAGSVQGIATQDGSGNIDQLPANETILCTGGSGGLFRITTNPRESRGDALAMAYEAGALLSDLEFVQFHPTAIDVDRDPAPLASEALRGEGAKLINADGTGFMERYDPMGELAPRDRVARAVHIEALSDRKAFLDTRDALGDEIESHFPTVFGACMSAGIDPRVAPIPVAPAAHYHMGGIVTDLWGRTSLKGLSACGECSSTGAHGANRLASNSLLEAVVFAARIADRLRDEPAPEADDLLTVTGRIAPDLSPEDLQELRIRMERDCGVVRSAEGLSSLRDWIAETSKSYENKLLPRALRVADLMVHSALRREESRGGHYRSDFPEAGHAPTRSYLCKGETGPIFLDPELKAI